MWCRHGMYQSSEYHIWASAKDRCTNPNNRRYKDYGGRGIIFYKPWHDFREFIKDMGVKPSDKHTLERIEVDGNYDPDNCVWLVRERQQRNRRDSVKLTYKGKTKQVNDWADELGVSKSVLYSRFIRGWPVEDIIETPVLKRQKSVTKLPRG